MDSKEENSRPPPDDECVHTDDMVVYSQHGHTMALRHLAQILELPLSTEFGLLQDAYKEFMLLNHPDKTVALPVDVRIRKLKQVQELNHAMKEVKNFEKKKEEARKKKEERCAQRPATPWDPYWLARNEPNIVCVLLLPAQLAHEIIPVLMQQGKDFPMQMPSEFGFAMSALQEISWEARGRSSAPLTMEKFLDTGYLYAAKMSDVQLRSFANFLAAVRCDLDIVAQLAASDVLPLQYNNDVELASRATAWITAMIEHDLHDYAPGLTLSSIDPLCPKSGFYACTLLAVTDSESQAKSILEVLTKQEAAVKAAADKAAKKRCAKTDPKKEAKKIKRESGEKVSREHILPPRRNRDSIASDGRSFDGSEIDADSAVDTAVKNDDSRRIEQAPIKDTTLMSVLGEFAKVPAVRGMPATVDSSTCMAKDSSDDIPKSLNTGSLIDSPPSTNFPANVERLGSLPSLATENGEPVFPSSAIHVGETEYSFPFQVSGDHKQLLLPGCPGFPIYIEATKKKYLEGEIAKNNKSHGSYIATLCRYLISDTGSRGIYELQRRSVQMRGTSKYAGIQGLLGLDFVENIKVWATSLGMATAGDSITRAMNAWKKREFEKLTKK